MTPYRSVVLIGTSHLYQFGGAARTPYQKATFEALLLEIVLKQNASALAEEMSLDALRQQERVESTVAAIANKLGLAHVYCDPSEEEQREMGLRVERSELALVQIEGWTREEIEIGIAREHRMREEYWLKCLLDLNVWPVVFVCGSKHTSEFASLLRRNAHAVTVVAECWVA